MDILLNQIDSDNKEVLEIKITHSNGFYNCFIHKSLISGNFSETMLFAKGNFRFKVFQGRKSQKKINKLEIFIYENQEQLKNLWLQGNYDQMINLIREKGVLLCLL